MNCQFTNEIHAYHDEALSAESLAKVESHLKSCADCAALLKDLRRVSRMIDEAPLVAMPSDAMARLQRQMRGAAVSRSLYRMTGWLTAAAAAVLIGVSVTGSMPSPTATGSQVANTADWESYALAPRDVRASGAEAGSEIAQSVQLMVDGFGVAER
jgi:anti-sigma factor RsiW